MNSILLNTTMAEYEQYELCGSDSDNPVMFIKKELKLIDGLLIKFSNVQRITLNYPRKCIELVHTYCVYYNTLKKSQKLQIGRVAMMANHKKYTDMYKWCMTWITDPRDIIPIANFVSMHRCQHITDILGMVMADLIHKYTPEELPEILNEQQTYTENDLESMSQINDWVDTMF